MSAAGAIRFGRYAFPPNRLGYCGPAEHEELFGYVASKTADKGLVELERRFEGAYPYLVLIARANGIADPFDDRVVDAYWIGNNCLERVEEGPFYDSLHERFRPKMDAGSFKWLAGKLELGARPHHNFHVFDIYTRAGLMRDERATIALGTMDSCRVSWGQVVAVEAAELVVDRSPLTFSAGKLSLGPPGRVRVMRQLGGQGFVDAVSPGDHVSIHWNWACDVLDANALARLAARTTKYLELANRTI